MMKKAISLLILTSVMLVAFSIPVFAADYSTVATQTNTSTVGSVTVGLKVVQMYPESSSVPYADGSVAVPFLYTVHIYNASSTPVVINNLKVAANFGSSGPIRYLTKVDNISSDLFFGIPNTSSAGWIDVLPSTTFSEANGTILPAGRNMYAVGVVYIHANYVLNTSTGEYVVDTPTLSGNPYINFSILNVSDPSFFDPGSSEDLSVIETALDDYIGDPTDGTVLEYLADELSELESISSKLNTIISTLGWSGSTPAYSPWSYYSTSANYSSSITGLTASATITASRSFTFNADFEKLTGTQGYFNYNTVVPVQLQVIVDNQSGSPVDITAQPYISGIANKNNGYSVVPGDIQSNGMTAIRITTNYSDIATSFEFNNGQLQIPEGRSVFVQNFYIIYTDQTWTEWRTYRLGVNLPGASLGSDTIQDQSEQIVNEATVIHNQETQWFQQNAQAIQGTGLSNYSWTTGGNLGVGTVVYDWNELWTAIDDWKLVYIFSITLTLAMTIIRYSVHGSRRKKQE